MESAEGSDSHPEMDSFEDSVLRFKEYGNIYKDIESDSIKEALIQSAPVEVIDAYTAVIKNILIENIKLTPEEFDIFRPFKEILKQLGFNNPTRKRQRELLAEGKLFPALSGVMSKLSTPRSAYQFRSHAWSD